MIIYKSQHLTKVYILSNEPTYHAYFYYIFFWLQVVNTVIYIKRGRIISGNR